MQDDTTIPENNEILTFAEKEMQKAYFAFEDEMLAIEVEAKEIRESKQV